jgi:pyridinium-3,5-biscarboxylic acid mononucleotide sulfurtransferase
MLSVEQRAALCEASLPKLEAMRVLIRECGSALVAFSGGVDSTFVLKVAHEVLGPRAVALTALSESVPEPEREEARRLAEAIGALQVEVASRELDNPDYARNPTDRCYHCKTELYELCEQARAQRSLAAVLDGFNADDVRDHRPGQRAATEHEVRSPLAEVGLTKAEVRAWSERLGLPTWDKPAAPCLASRIPYGTKVTAERLVRIGQAEAAVRALGFRVFRVRLHEPIARLELAADELPRLFDAALRAQLNLALRGLGFLYVTVDLEPFRSGRLNEAAGLTPSPSHGLSLPVLG